MPLAAFLLILFAALAHSSWNFLAKRAAHRRNLIWFASVGEALLLLPFAVWLAIGTWDRITWKAAAFLLATGVLHVFYTESLLRGYRAGDLSVVYPVARGTGPLLSFIGAIFLLGDRPSLIAGTGALSVTAGILLVSGAQNFRRPAAQAGLRWGIATGLTIAGYTLVDGYSVRVLLMAPLIVEYAGNLFRTIVLSATLRGDQSSLVREYRLCWREALGISVLTPAGYVLVLYAMRIAPVSHVAPAREMSMMIGAWFGVRLLNEGHLARKMAGSVLIAAGVAGLAFG